MLNRRVIRVLQNATEITANLVNANGANYVLALQTTDSLYLGYHGKFASRYFQVGVANAVVSAVTVTYWDGSAWQAVDDLVDQTSVGGATWAQSGFISWQNKEDWQPRSLTGIDADVELYWIRLQVSVNLTGTAALKSVLNLYCDDALLAAYFPELVSDANYLPPGETNFVKQYLAARDLVVLRLKQRKMISHEAQILEPNDVAIAATYAAARMILQPIATSDATKDLLKLASDGFEDEIGRINFAIDEDQTGTVTDNEREQVLSVGVFRR